MPKKVTIGDVAEKAGVSMMTVSRAFNNKGSINSATKQRILQLAQEMGYHPNSAVGSLMAPRTATIGFVVPDIANPFFSQIARGVENVARIHQHNVFLLNTDEDVDREISGLNSLIEKQVDGLILCSSRLDQTQMTAILNKFPFVVLINRILEIPIEGICTINVDNQKGAEQAIDHLVDRGHTEIGYVAGPEYSHGGRQRLAGYRLSLEKHGLHYRDELVRYCAPNSEGGYAAAMGLLANYPKLTAIFAFNDLTATGVVRACRDLGRCVPGEVAVIGADDIPLASLVTPALSTLRVNKKGLGATAMRILAQLIKKESQVEPCHQIVTPELIIRGSS